MPFASPARAAIPQLIAGTGAHTAAITASRSITCGGGGGGAALARMTSARAGSVALLRIAPCQSCRRPRIMVASCKIFWVGRRGRCPPLTATAIGFPRLLLLEMFVVRL